MSLHVPEVCRQTYSSSQKKIAEICLLRCTAVGRSTPKKKWKALWHCLYSSYKGIFEDSGGSDYQQSRGSCAVHNRRREAGDEHDQVVHAGVVKFGRHALQQLQKAAEEALRSSSDDDSLSEESDD